MIKLENLTPKVYSNMSRDFQFIERLFNVLLNYIKTNSQIIYGLPNIDNLDSRFVELLATTLGFNSKKTYNEKQLKAICKIFPSILKYKGSLESIKLTLSAILQAEGIKEKYAIINDSIDDNNEEDNVTSTSNVVDSNGVLSLALPSGLTDISLFKEILKYILPAGVRLNLISSNVRIYGDVKTEVGVDSRVVLGWYNTTPEIFNGEAGIRHGYSEVSSLNNYPQLKNAAQASISSSDGSRFIVKNSNSTNNKIDYSEELTDDKKDFSDGISSNTSLKAIIGANNVLVINGKLNNPVEKDKKEEN